MEQNRERRAFDPIRQRVEILSGNAEGAEEVGKELNEIIKTVEQLVILHKRSSTIKAAIEAITSKPDSVAELIVNGQHAVEVDRDAALALYQHTLARAQAGIRELSAKVEAIRKAIKQV
jgi:hypothetical protein